MGISDEIEVATVAIIDETTILEIKATTVLPFWSPLPEIRDKMAVARAH